MEPDWSTDAFMRAEAMENHKHSIMTNFVVRMLGLGICSDTEVGPGPSSCTH